MTCQWDRIGCFCAVAAGALLVLTLSVLPAWSRPWRLASPDLFKEGIHYKNNRSRHKVIVHSGEQQLYGQLLDQGATLTDDYGSFALLSVPDRPLQAMDARSTPGFFIRD